VDETRVEAVGAERSFKINGAIRTQLQNATSQKKKTHASQPGFVTRADNLITTHCKNEEYGSSTTFRDVSFCTSPKFAKTKSMKRLHVLPHIQRTPLF
jgi:hypothetical protein